MVGVWTNKEGFDQLTFFDVREEETTGQKVISFDLPRAIIVSGSGAGKSVFLETVGEIYFHNKCKIVKLTDEKGNLEMGYCAFEPREDYHIRQVKFVQGRELKKYDINIMMPFSFNIKKDERIKLKKQMPPIRFFTINIKTLTKENLSVMFNLDVKSGLVDVAMHIIKGLGKHDGLPQFFTKFREAIKDSGDKKYKGHNVEFIESLSEDTGLSADKSDRKNLKTYLKPFYEYDRFIGAEDNPYNIDMVELLNDVNKMDTYTYRALSEQKSKDVCMEILIEQIRQALDSGRVRYPVLLLADESTSIFPPEPVGYKFRLSQNQGQRLMQMRNKSKEGFGFLIASHTFTLLSENITKMGMAVLLGHDTSEDDKNKILKNYNAENRREIDEIPRGVWHLKGYTDTIGFKVAMPCHAHKELRGYDFYDDFVKFYPDKCKVLEPDYDSLCNIFFDEDQRDKELIDEKNRKVKEDIDKIEAEKERRRLEKESGEKKPKESVEKKKKEIDPATIELIRKMYLGEILDKDGKEISMDRMKKVLSEEYKIEGFHFYKVQKIIKDAGWRRIKKEVSSDGETVMEVVVHDKERIDKKDTQESAERFDGKNKEERDMAQESELSDKNRD